MSFDVQFCSLVDSLQILEAVELVGAVPRTIRLRTRSGFQNAQRVLVNDYAVDTFTVVNDSYILVNLPSMFDAITLGNLSFEVISSSYSGGQSARVVFGTTKNVRRVDGLQKLVQHVVKTLLSNVGSNRFTSGEGGGLLRSLGATLSLDARAQITTSLATAVSRTEEQVFAAQNRYQGLQSTERLLTLQLGGVNFIEDNLEVRASVRLVNYAGNSTNIPLTL